MFQLPDLPLHLEAKVFYRDDLPGTKRSVFIDQPVHLIFQAVQLISFAA